MAIPATWMPFRCPCNVHLCSCRVNNLPSLVPTQTSPSSLGNCIGVGYLSLLLGIGIHEVNSWTLILVAIDTSFVATLLHLLILTFVVACLVVIGQMTQPYVLNVGGFLAFILYAVIAG